MFKHYSHKELIATIIKHNNSIVNTNLNLCITNYHKVVDNIEKNYVSIIIGSEPQYDGETTSVADSVDDLQYCHLDSGVIKCSKENTTKIPQQYIPDELLCILNTLYKDKIIR